MNKYILFFVLAALTYSCSRVPITNRRQSAWESEAYLERMSDSMYRDFLTKNKLTNNKSQSDLVKKVGNNISTAITEFFKTYENGKYYKTISKYQWEFNTVEDPIANAWCMPGGKVVVYTGLLPVTLDEAGLAVVMGHEIAHAVAKHGNERMTQQMKAQGLGSVLSVAVSGSPSTTQNIFATAFGIAGNLTLLKYSRKHETEADKIGLVFMALAGYDPNTSIAFWERMSNLSGGAQVPEFLSTHPSDVKRISDLKEWMPEAMKYYKKKS